MAAIDATRSPSSDISLFAEIEPYATGRIPLDAIHVMHWEACGNPNGVPLVFLHGGPGGGCLPHHRRFYDPAFWNIVLYDQRGAGRSTPAAELADNTTQHLVADLERLREELGVRALAGLRRVVGVDAGARVRAGASGTCARPGACAASSSRLPPRSTGSCMACAMSSPRRGARSWKRFPQQSARTCSAAIIAGSPIAIRRVHLPAARAWDRYEGACSTLLPVADPLGRFDGDAAALAIARIEAHYFVNQGFLAPNQLQDGVAKHPPPSVHDRAGPLRHRLPAGHGRRARARLAGSRVRRRAGRRAFGARARNHARTGGRGEADAGARQPQVTRSGARQPA